MIHSLILLLILSGLLETLALVILPAVELAQGRIKSHSAFCQVSGFLLSVGIEACDLTVLLIALHTGLYVFRGRSGLYPYRLPAYTLVATGSLMLASLAFVNETGFINSGAYCYLPARPQWTLTALSWAPRYIVCVIIVLTYTCINIYGRWIITRVGEGSKLRKSDEPFLSLPPQLRPRRGSVPPTPPITYHGLIPPTPPCDMGRSDYGWGQSGRYNQGPRAGTRKGSLATLEEGQSLSTTVALPTAQIDWEDRPPVLDNDLFQGNSHRGHHKIGSKDDDYSLSPVSRPNTALHNVGCCCMQCTGSRLPHAQYPVNIELELQGDVCTAEPAHNLLMSPSTMNETRLPSSRKKSNRQLRLLFIYPIVYILGWIMPFVAHVSKADRTGNPSELVMCGLVSMCAQGMADSLVFLILEKPWRHPRHERLKCMFTFRRCPTKKNTSTRVGRTREEMVVDGKIARRRREREEVERRLRQQQQQQQQLKQKGGNANKQEWWDVKLAGIDETGGEDIKTSHESAV